MAEFVTAVVIAAAVAVAAIYIARYANKVSRKCTPTQRITRFDSVWIDPESGIVRAEGRMPASKVAGDRATGVLNKIFYIEANGDVIEMRRTDVDVTFGQPHARWRAQDTGSLQRRYWSNG